MRQKKKEEKKIKIRNPQKHLCPTTMYHICRYFILVGQALYLGTSHLSTPCLYYLQLWEHEIYVIFNINSSWTAWPWRWKHYDPLKSQELHAHWLCYILKACIFVFTTVRTSNCASVLDGSLNFETSWDYRSMLRFHRNVLSPMSSHVVLLMLPIATVGMSKSSCLKPWS
jgi:hypothetical protein